MNVNPHIVILAAGAGKRMKSDLPKVLHPVLYRPMIHYVLDLAFGLPHRSVTMVVGHGEDLVREACREYQGVRYCRQEEQLGTGHAVRAAEEQLRDAEGPVLILSGDVILLRPSSLKRLLDRHVKEAADCTLGTGTLGNPHGYGRILRQMDGRVIDIREEGDCSPSEREINEVNAGIYCIAAKDLLDALRGLTNGNEQREYYLTDVVKALASRGAKVIPYSFGDPLEIAGINDRHALWRVETELQERIGKELLHQGVTLQDPRSTWIDPRCRIGRDVRIEASCVLVDTVLEDGAVVESHCRLVGSRVGARALIRQGSYIEGSEVAAECSVGPYARLRPGARLGRRVKVGNFVEVKNSSLGEGTKASHLSYIGDAEIGKDVNVGCGFITCNYDGGPEKRRTVVEDRAFIGSDCQAVAPVRIGADSYVAAGSTVTEDVPAGSLAIARSRQTVKDGYVRRRRRPAGDRLAPAT